MRSLNTPGLHIQGRGEAEGADIVLNSKRHDAAGEWSIGRGESVSVARGATHLPQVTRMWPPQVRVPVSSPSCVLVLSLVNPVLLCLLVPMMGEMDIRVE